MTITLEFHGLESVSMSHSRNQNFELNTKYLHLNFKLNRNTKALNCMDKQVLTR